MALLFNWLFAGPKAPERVHSDIIIPVHSRDDTNTNRNIVIEFTMRFDEELDAARLAEALWKLIDRPGWRRLGARLRLTPKGKLEYHLPGKFTKDRPPINFTHATHDIRLSEHPAGAKFPVPDGSLKGYIADDSMRDVTSPANPAERLTSMNDWIYSDKAQLGLHVANFSDATLVTLTWLHTLLDAMGRNALIKAWIAVLEGRDEDVPEFWGYDFDPLEKLGAPGEVDDKASITTSTSSGSAKSPAKEQLILKDRILTGFQMFKLIVPLLWSVFLYPREAKGGIIMPGPYFARLKAQAFADLASAPADLITPSGTDPSKPFLSDGDIITAFLTRVNATANPSVVSSSPSRTISVMNVFGLRELLTSTSPQLLPRGKAYIGNCASVITSLFSAKDFFALPLGHVAARIRKDLTLQGTRNQQDATFALARNGGQPPLYGSSDMALFTMTNWLKGRFFEADFSAAIVGINKDTKPKEQNAFRGKPKAILAQAHNSRWFPLRGATGIMGKDNEGNYWLGSVMREGYEESFLKVVEGLR